MSSVHRRVGRGFVASLSLALVASAALAAEAPALRFDALAIVDTLHADEPSFTTALGHLELRLTGDAARLSGSPATTLRLETLADEGAKPNERVGTLQGMRNIEVRRNAARLYAAWLQHAFSPELDALVGLYDLNSGFYATDASSLLIHPAFGVGAELAQTGRNGPSIFPDLAAGVRVRARSPRCRRARPAAAWRRRRPRSSACAGSGACQVATSEPGRASPRAMAPLLHRPGRPPARADPYRRSPPGE